MNPTSLRQWIPIDRVDALIEWEPLLVIVGLALVSWVIYKAFLRKISNERHNNLRNHFLNLMVHLAVLLLLFSAYSAIKYYTHSSAITALGTFVKLSAYVGLLTLIWGGIVFVKTSKILVFEYLFLGHMKVGVPVLLVNIFTLMLSLILAGWGLAEVFQVRLTPLLATSAILSIVLGLAIQDTLGNLFAGLAMQFDKPYQIGHWIEVHNGGQKWVGQVLEVSWRATVLVGFGEELITIPNRVVAQSEVGNFSIRNQPIVRSQLFRVGHSQHPEAVKKALLAAANVICSIRKEPAPLTLISETTESWVAYKLIYFIEDYGAQYIIADELVSQVLKQLDSANIMLANQKLYVVRDQGG